VRVTGRSRTFLDLKIRQAFAFDGDFAVAGSSSCGRGEGS
jgi:hypothetical protein